MRQWKSTFRVKYQHYNYHLPLSVPVLPKKHKNAIKIKPNSNKCFMEYLRVRANIIDQCLWGTTVCLTGTPRLLWLIVGLISPALSSPVNECPPQEEPLGERHRPLNP